MRKELLRLSEESTGSEKRLFEIFRHFFYVDANYQDTWASLFKTKGYEKSRVHKEKVRERLHAQIRKMYPDATRYHYEMIGSTKLLDVQLKRRQTYLITLEMKDETICD